MNNALMNEYYELADMQVLPSLAEYAKDWWSLACEFAKAGMPAMAGMCYARAEFYEVQGDGEHIRVIEGSFAELLEA